VSHWGKSMNEKHRVEGSILAEKKQKPARRKRAGGLPGISVIAGGKG